MGNELIKIYKDKIKGEWKLAFISTFIVGMLVHIYKLTNTLLNHDSLYNFYSNQNTVGSGRWFLSIACGFTSFFDLPWINGLVSILLIALTAVVIVEIFKVENSVLIILISGLMAAFPGVTETFYFQFTSDGYMLAMLLAALTVYFSTFERKGLKWISLSIAMICLSCGIYQAYVSFAMVLTVFYFINEIFENRRTNPECGRYILKQIIIYVLGMILYYVIWQLSMHVQNIQANNYQGIAEVSHLGGVSFSLGWLLKGILNCIKTVVFFFLEWNVFEHGINFYGVMNVIVIVAFFAAIIMAIVKSHIIHNKIQFVLVLTALAAVVPSSCIWYFASDSIGYRPMMLFCLVFIYIYTAILYDRWFEEKISNVAGIILLVTVINWGIVANISYFYMNQSNEQTYATGLEMVMRIHEIESEQPIDQIAVVGDRSKEVFFGNVDEHSSKIHMMNQLLEYDMLYDREHTKMFLTKVFNLDTKFADGDVCQDLEEKTFVEDMDVWPSYNSMQVVDGILIIKIGDISEE